MPNSKRLYKNFPMIRLWLILVLVFSYCEVSCAAPRSLGISLPKSDGSIAYDMNKVGQVAAVVQDKNGDQLAVLYDKKELIQIGTLGGNHSDARRINSVGEVVGSANRQDGTWGAYVYSRSNGIRDIGTLGGLNSHGTAINDRGDVVGFSDLENHEWHAFLYSANNSLRDLGTLGGKVSYASAINNSGQVVGAATLVNGYRHAFIYDDTHGLVDLGTLGGHSSYASSINDSGTVVGASETVNRDWHAFVYDGKKMVDMGTLFGQWDSFPVSINSAGHIVGTLKFNDNQRSFVWHDGVVAIHRPGVTGLYVINAINDAGVVIGATYRGHLNAATMLYSAVPPRSDEWFFSVADTFLFSLLSLLIVTVATMIIFSGRYKGISFHR